MNAFVSAFSREISVMVWEDRHWSRAPCWRCGRIARLHWFFSCTTRLATICASNHWGPWMLVVVFSQLVADKWCDMWRIHRHVDCAWWLEIIWLWYLLCNIYIYMHCSAKRWCVLLRQRPPVVGFCPPYRRRWGWVSGSFLEQEPTSPPSVRGWVLARHPESSRIVGLGTSFYSQDEPWRRDTDGFIPPPSTIKSKG